jgi:hypothetical protein
MFDPDKLPELQALIRESTARDAVLLADVLKEVHQLKRDVVTIQPRNTNSISLVAADGGNNRIRFNPFYLQVVRIVDSNGAERFLDVVSPSTDTAALGRRHLDEQTPLGRLMRDLNVDSLAELSPMIPVSAKSSSWTLVYRDLCEWAVLYELISYREWGSDTLVVHDGLLRTKIFAGELFVDMYKLIRAAIQRLWNQHRIKLYLVGIAKHSEVLDRYRLGIAIADVLPAGQPQYTSIDETLQRNVYSWAEYVRSPDDAPDDTEKPKYNMGVMYFVRFGTRVGDPIWTVDLLAHQADRAQEIFGSLVGDAEMGFPVPFYPYCLQQADAYAQVVDFDLAILQDTLVEAVRDQIVVGRRHAFDALRLETEDPAARRYSS